MIPDNQAVVNRLTRQQRLVWQRLSHAAPEAVTPGGAVKTDWLARAWGDLLPGSRILVYVTIHAMNKRLAPVGVRIQGRHPTQGGGYQVVVEAPHA